jgi:electron transport complex protein RnfC
MQLLPQQLYWYGRAKNTDKLRHYHIHDCIECGCCAVVCPSHIPLVHYFRFAKSAIAEQEANRAMANQSRVRNEARQARLDRMKAEQEARKAARKAARKRKQQDKPASAENKPPSSEQAASAEAADPADKPAANVV